MTLTRLALRAIGLPGAFYSWFVYQLNGRDCPSRVADEDRQLHIKELMTSTRIMLGAIGLFGPIGWCIFCWFMYCMNRWGCGSVSSRVSGEELFIALSPMGSFIFYLVIASRPCHAMTALVVGVVVHIPLVFVVIAFLLAGGAAPFFSLAFLPGLMLWLIYVRQLSRHQNAA